MSYDGECDKCHHKMATLRVLHEDGGANLSCADCWKDYQKFLIEFADVELWCDLCDHDVGVNHLRAEPLKEERSWTGDGNQDLKSR